MLTRTLATLVVVALTRPALACPEMSITNVPVTATGTKLPDGGGVIFVVRHGRGGPDPEEPFRLQAGHEDVASVEEQIAPGLYVMRPTARRARTFDLVQGTTVVGHFAQAVRVAPVAPPAILVVTSDAVRPPPPATNTGPGIPRTLTTIQLADVPPPNAYALVVYAMTSDGRVMRAWTPAVTGGKHYRIATGGKGCGGVTAVPTNQGDRLAFAWLDTGGRLSKLSRTFTVGAP